MKTKQYYYLSELFNILMTLIFLYSLAGAFCYLYDLIFGPTLIIGLILIVLFTYFIRRLRFSYAGVPAILLQVGLMIGMFFIPVYVPYLVFLFIIFFVYLVMNAKFFMSHSIIQFAELHIAFIAVPVIGYLFMNIKHSREYMIFYFILCVLFIIFFYARLFFSNASLLATQRSQYDRMPYKEMIINDSKLAIPFVAVTLVLMALVNFDFMDDVFMKFYYWAVDGLRFVFKYVFLFLEWLVTHLISDVDDVQQATQIVESVEEGAYESSFFAVLASIIFVSILVVFAIIIIKNMIKMIKAMRGARGAAKEAVVETDMIEIKERLKGRNKKTSDRDLSEIRRKYKKTIEKKTKEGYQLFRSHTPRERAEDLKEKKRFDIYELSEKYQAERYGRN